jgi:pimeloyl-ACP methyl ester carboxylesterase
VVEPAGTRRAAVIIVRTFAALLLLGMVTGFIYEDVGRRRDLQRIPQIGQSIDIGGRSLNIYCSGAGDPSVVFESGADIPGYSWAHIQAEIAKVTRSCWYDRAGEGWSDPGPFPRTSEAIAKDLHALLGRADIRPPYVLVGHSIGGLHIRVYNGLYPGEVAGVVLVDAAHEDEPKRAPPFMRGHTLPRLMWRPLHIVVQAANRFGLLRLALRSVSLSDDPSRRTPDQIVAALRRLPKAVATSAGDATVPESYAQAHAAGGLGDRPLIVLTRAKPPSRPQVTDEERQAAAYEQVWMHELQPQLARLSTRGRQILVSSSGHRIPDEAPDAVVEAVFQVLGETRNTARPQTVVVDSSLSRRF